MAEGQRPPKTENGSFLTVYNQIMPEPHFKEVKQDDTETTVSKVQHTERITHKGSLYPLQD